MATQLTDWQGYLSANQDLGKAGITTQAQAQQHYDQFGAKENRQGGFAQPAAAQTINLGGQNYTQEQAKNYFATRDANSIARDSAKLGLTRDQIINAAQFGGVSGGDTGILGQSIDDYVSKADNGYAFGANGALATSGGMDIAGHHLTPQQIKDFYASGGDDNRVLQENGITDQRQIHQIAGDARNIAGNPLRGEQALQSYFKRYQQYNPNGAHANDYAGWVRTQDPVRLAAMQAGAFTGTPTSTTDWEPGGIYGPESSIYGKEGYGSGLGPQGNGGSWSDAGSGNGTGAQPGSTGGILGGGSYGQPNNAGGNNSNGGSTSSTSSSSSSGGGAPGNWQVTPDQTVESRIAGILNSGNPLVEQRRAQSDMRMNARGLVNSSIAQTASDVAANEAALEIARPDAATFADAAKTNALAKTQWGISQANNQTSRDVNTANNQTSRDNTQANIAAQRDLQQATQLYNNLATQTATASSVQDWGNKTITAIHMAPDLSADAKNAAISAVQQYLADSYTIQGDWHTSAARAIDAIFN